jgi:hypothetical protein
MPTGLQRIEPRHLPLSARLDTWSDRAWTDGIQVDARQNLDRLLVRTRNTVYEVTLISAHTGEAIVRGGRFFPVPTRAVILGSSLGGAFLKLRGIYCGFSLELYCAGTRIVTSGVQSVKVVNDRSAGPVQ